MKRILRVLALGFLTLLPACLVFWLSAHLFTSGSQLARTIAWLDSDVGDYRRFPMRPIHRSGPVFNFSAPTPEQQARYAPLFERVDFDFEGRRIQRGWDDFMQWTDTAAFLVIQDDVLLYEGYFNGYSRDATVTSFSVAKSWVSALTGIAIDEGLIGSLEDPITLYVPELLAKDPRYANIRLRHLVSMASGIRYEESGLPWSDDADTYYSPDLRAVAISSPIIGEPGIEWHYNNYHPLLMGLVLERVTGMPVAQYLEQKIWSQIGMEADGSWSLDSEQSGFEKMESGINARAIDFAKFGRLYLHQGSWDGKQIISQAWVEASTQRDRAGDPAEHYQYFWWVDTQAPGDHFYAAGKHGQYIYIVPEQQLILVRFGRTDPRRVWRSFFEYLGNEMAGAAAEK